MKCACDVCGLDAAEKHQYCGYCAAACHPLVNGQRVEVPRHLRVIFHAAMRKPSKEEIANIAKHAGMKTILSILRGGRG